MSTEYTILNDGVEFSVVEQSTKVTLMGYSELSSPIVIESNRMEPEELIAKLMFGIQGCLYSSNLTQEEFIEKHVKPLFFSGVTK